MPSFYSPSTNGFYDTTVISYDLPSDVIQITREQHTNFVSEMNQNNKVIVVVDGNITLQDRNDTITWEEIKFRRNSLLMQSDYTQLADNTSQNKVEWANYRQALRDIPQTYANPADVIWPTPPV